MRYLDLDRLVRSARRYAHLIMSRLVTLWCPDQYCPKFLFPARCCLPGPAQPLRVLLSIFGCSCLSSCSYSDLVSLCSLITFFILVLYRISYGLINLCNIWYFLPPLVSKACSKLIHFQSEMASTLSVLPFVDGIRCREMPHKGPYLDAWPSPSYQDCSYEFVFQFQYSC